jgi:hypothetical protein
MISQTSKHEPPDMDDLYRVSREADRLSQKLISLRDELADARMVLEYDSERRKSALSRAVLAAFKAGADSTSRAEHEARSSAKYEEDMRLLSQHYAKAEQIRLDFETTKIRLEVLRSMLSTQRSLIEMQ